MRRGKQSLPSNEEEVKNPLIAGLPLTEYLRIKSVWMEEARKKNLIEGEIHRYILKRHDEFVIERKNSPDRRGRPPRYSSKTLLKVLELIDTHGVSSRAIYIRLNLSSARLSGLIHGRERPYIMLERCRILGISPEEYPEHCGKMRRSLNRNSKKLNLGLLNESKNPETAEKQIKCHARRVLKAPRADS